MVIGGVTGTLTHPSSLLLGRFDHHGRLRYLSQTNPITAAHRRDLTGLLQPMAFQGEGSGHPWPWPLPAAWSIDLADRQPLRYVPVEPALVAEIDVDVAQDGPVGRFRHRTRYVRLRADLIASDVSLWAPDGPAL